MENPDFCPATHWKSRRCHASRRFRPTPSDSCVEPSPESPQTGLSKRSASLGTPGKPRGETMGENGKMKMRKNSLQTGWYIYMSILYNIYIYRNRWHFFWFQNLGKNGTNAEMATFQDKVAGCLCLLGVTSGLFTRSPFLTSMHFTWAWFGTWILCVRFWSPGPGCLPLKVMISLRTKVTSMS